MKFFANYQKAKISQISQIEDFNNSLALQLETSPIDANNAKRTWNAVRMSLRSNNEPDIKKVHYLNIQYTFAKFGEVPQEIQSLVNFLEANESKIDWNSVLMNLEILWRMSEV
jgi:hypothetical protein